MPTVLLLTALDTRGEEAMYLKGFTEALGCKVIIVDIAMRAHGQEGADYSCVEVARQGGADFKEISSQKGTSAITEPMQNGAISIAKKLYEQGAIDAIAGFGGASNTLFLSSVMRALPFGFPKLILSSSAAMPAYSARYFAHKDIVIFHACLDINGLNRFVRDLLRRFSGMIAGVAGIERTQERDTRKLVAISEFQFSEKCARAVRSKCAGDFEIIPFHAQGVGDRIMEEMISDGMFDGVIDLVPAGLSEAMLGGNRAAGLDRFDRELDKGIPVILTPCGFDALSCGPYSRRLTDPLWKKKNLAKRKIYVQDEMRVQARTSKREMEEIGRVFAEKLSRAKGPTALYIPLKGFSSLGVEGGPLFDPEADAAFVKSLKRHLKPGTGRGVELIEMECSMEDAALADSIAEKFSSMMAAEAAN
jgi:uncharacterized protein (UPF0261 family)